MTDMNMKIVREKFPQYDDLSDQQLADSLHQKFYADMPAADFYGKIGFAPQDAPESFAGQAQDLGFPTPPADPRRAPAAPPAPAMPQPFAAPQSPPPPPPSDVPPEAMTQMLTQMLAPQAGPAPGAPGPVPPAPGRVGQPGAMSPQALPPGAKEPSRNMPEPGWMADKLGGGGVLVDILQGRDPQMPAGLPPVQGPPQPSQPLADLGKRAARGLTEVGAAVPEALAVVGGGNPNASALMAQEEVTKAQEQIAAAQARLRDNPQMGNEDRKRITGVITDSQKIIESYQPLVDVAEGPLRPDAQDRPIYKKGQAIRDASLELFGTPDPQFDDRFLGKLAEGGGNMAGFIGVTLLTGPLGGAASGSALNTAGMYRRAKQDGASEEQARTAAYIGSIVGASEVVPIARAFDMIPSKLRGKVANALGKRLGNILATAGEEGVQEALAEIANNLTEKGVWNPEQQVFEGAGESFLIGAILGGGMGAIAGPSSGEGPATQQRVVGEPSPAAPEEPRPEARTVEPLAPNAGVPPIDAAAPYVLTPQQRAQPEAQPAPQAPQGQAPDDIDALTAAMTPGGNIEVMDETEIVNGEKVPTGRKVAFNFDTGEVTVVGEGEKPAAPDPQPAQPQPPEAPDVGTDDAPAADGTDPGAVESPEAEAEGDRGAGTIRTQTLTSEEVGQIETDAATFQYKDNGDEAGVTDRLQGVEDWDERSAMGGIVYEYADGRRVAADGHQRLGLAKRLQAKGKQTPWNVEIIRETDGFTPADVRRIAALKNIREGSGTAIDAAKVLRQAPDEIDTLNLPPKSALVRDAKGLARLSDDAFGMVANEVVKPEWGAVVGENVADPALHADVVALLKKLQPKNNAQAAMIAQQAGQESVTEAQGSLFGDEQVSESLYLERAKVLDAALKRLKKDRATFKLLSDRASTISQAGNVLNSEANAARVEADSTAAAYLAAEANRKGPISDALTAAARDFKANPKQGARIVRDFLAAIRDGETGGQVDEGVRPDSGQPDPAPEQGQGQSVEPEPAPAGDSLFGDLPEQQAKPDTSEMEAIKNQSKIRKLDGNTGDAGPLFDDQTDMLDQAESQEASQNVDEAGTFVDRSEGEKDSADFNDRRDELPDRIPVDQLGAEARRLTLEPGRERGVEHLMMIDGEGRIVAYGSGSAHGTGVPGVLPVLAWRGGEDVIAHHNHPSSSAFSPQDYAIVFTPGTRGVYIHGHDDSVLWAGSTEKGRALLKANGTNWLIVKLQTMDRNAWKASRPAWRRLDESGEYDIGQDTNAPWREYSFATFKAMDEVGLINGKIVQHPTREGGDRANPYFTDPDLKKVYEKIVKALRELVDTSNTESIKDDRIPTPHRHPGRVEKAPGISDTRSEERDRPDQGHVSGGDQARQEGDRGEGSGSGQVDPDFDGALDDMFGAEKTVDLTDEQKKAVKRINTVLKLKNESSPGHYVSGRQDVQIDYTSDESDIEFIIGYTTTKFAGGAKMTDTRNKRALLSEIDGHLSDEAMQVVEGWKAYYEGLGSDPEQKVTDDGPSVPTDPLAAAKAEWGSLDAEYKREFERHQKVRDDYHAQKVDDDVFFASRDRMQAAMDKADAAAERFAAEERKAEKAAKAEAKRKEAEPDDRQGDLIQMTPPPKKSGSESPTGVDYPNRKLNFRYARSDETAQYDDMAWFNIAASNMRKGDVFPSRGIGMFPKGAVVESVTEKTLTVTDRATGKKARLTPSTDKWEQLARDAGGVMSASHHGVDPGDLVTALLRDPAASRDEAGVLQLVDAQADAPSTPPKKRPKRTKAEIAKSMQAKLRGLKESTAKTDSPTFKRWFGDSKVVDDDGKPLVVYHATNADFEAFDMSRLGSETRRNATSEAAGVMAEVGVWSNSRDLQGDMMTERTLPLFMAIGNPLEISFSDLWTMADGFETGGELRADLAEQGYDGLIVADEEFGGQSYVAFSPEQIKSVNNRGTFDPNDPHMLREDTKRFNDDTYNALIEDFTDALDGADPRGQPRRQVFATMMKPLVEAGLTREDVKALQPYFTRFLEDVESGKIALDERELDAPGTGDDLEPVGGDTAAGDGVGGDDVSSAAGGNGRGAGSRRGSADHEGGERQGGERVSDGDAASVGARRDPGDDREDGTDREPAAGGKRAGGRDNREQGLPADPGRTEDTERHAQDAPDRDLADRQAQQDRADRIKVKPGDRANIDKTLPLLLPEQRDDVEKVEARFAKPDGHGMLITNGTGTGKTYSGGGVIKRFTQAGKNNILILAPSQGILDAWVAMGADMGIPISKLDSTTEAGEGVVATTYANAGENNALAHRDWDLVVPDEAHKLSQNAAGDATSALQTVRAITNRPADLWNRAKMVNAEEWAAWKDMPGRETEMLSAEQQQAAQKVKDAKRSELMAKDKALIEKWQKENKRSKVLFLSATPFAYDKNVDYAEGYLFDYPEGGTTDSGSRQGGREFFMVENFGYRIRYRKLTKPEAAVDTGVFEREFHEKLKREGVLTGRQLDIEADYDRKFAKIRSADGEKIDAAMDLIHKNGSGNTATAKKWRELDEHVRRNFNYLRRMQLLEAIKAKEAIPDIQKHLDLGRKVVVFHDYNKGGGFNPFSGRDVVTPTTGAMEAYRWLVSEMPEVRDLNFAGLLAPKDAILKAFGSRAAQYNGTVPNKERTAAKAAFNTDGSGVDVLVVQSAAGEAEISLHDTTGGHQRALINLGMPVRPTTTLQEEGRIRRVGSVSDAVFRYYTTGTTWERAAFAGKIAQNSGTVENLALGNDARAIRDAFINAYMDADVMEPTAGDGKGGRDADRSIAKTSPYDQAKTHYFGRMKNTAKRDRRAGIDFYATPEPLGFKMAGWAGTRAYEKVLEPSAGDGAIARYLPGDADRTLIEPSPDLITKAELRATGAKAIQERFEDHHIVNKYDAVVMNPPFGSGGKTAMEHVLKATRHLRNGGRIVALIPTGPAADKRFDAMRDQIDPSIQISAIVNLPPVTFEKAGTSVAARVVIFDRVDDKSADLHWQPAKNINLTGAQNIGDFFDRLEDIDVPARPVIDTPQPETDAATETVTPGPVEGNDAFETFEFFHTQTGKNKFGAQLRDRVERDAFKAVLAVAKANRGYYSRFKSGDARPGFLFNSAEDRAAFIEDAGKPRMGLAETVEEFSTAGEAITAALPALRAELDRLNLKRVALAPDTHGDRQGAFRAQGDRLEILIGPALDPEATLHHEALHAMRALNLFTPREWRALEVKAARTWVEQYDIPARYPDLLPSEQIEEAIAEAFADAVKAKKAPGGVLTQAFNKIGRILKALANALRGAGFQTVEDVFGKAMAGEIGKRDPGEGFVAAMEMAEKHARFPKRITAQQRAHQQTAMNRQGGALYLPDRRIWEELSAKQASIWDRLRGGAAAANDHVDKARIRIQDRFLPVLRAQEAIIRQTGRPLPEEHNAYLAEETFSGKVGRHLFEIDEDFTKPIIDLMAGGKGESMIDPDEVGTWLYARHARERNARIASINPNMPDGGSGMTNAEAAQILADAASGPNAARLKAIGALLDRLRERTLKLREDAGLISAKDAQIWRSQYKHYVPLKGWADTDHSEAYLDVTGVGRRFNTRGQESKQALGRQSEAFNPLQGALTQAQEVAIRAEKNRVGQALYKLAKDFPSPRLWSVKTPKQKRTFNRTTGLVETYVEQPVTLFMDPNEMALKIDGKEHRVLFHDVRLARAAGSVGADQMGWFIGLMSKASRWFSSVNTMLDPEFVIRNAFRDMTAAQINIRNFGKDDRNALAKAMVKNWPKAFAGAYRGQLNKADSEWTKYYREFEESGAKVSFWVLDQPEAAAHDLKKRVKLAGGNVAQRASRFVRISTRDNPVLGFIERTNLAVDNAVRLAAYVEARKKGWTKAQAASLAKNLTVNFNRRGEWGATINALYPFANAGIQGTQILFRAMTSKRMAKYGLGMVALGAILDQVNAGLSDEDDDGELAYDKIPDWKNQMNLVVMLGPEADNAATLWLPYGYNLFPYMGQQASKIMRGVKEPGDAMADFAAAVFGSFSPLGGRDMQSVLTPTMLDPINEMAMNQDWLGRPIRPENPWSDYGPDAYKHFRGVSGASRAISDAANRATGGTVAESGWLDVSPEYIDHAFGFITGGAGRFVGRTSDTMGKLLTGQVGEIESRNIPFYRSLQYETGDWLDRDRYYRFRNEVLEAVDAQKTYQENNQPVPAHIRKLTALHDANKQMERILKKTRAAKRAIDARDDLTATEKSKRREEIAKREEPVYLRFNRLFLQRMGPQGE